MSADQAWEALKSGDRAQAALGFISVLEHDNQDYSALLGLARVYILQRRLDDASKLAQAAANIQQSVDLQILQAELLGGLGDRRKAIELLGRILSMNPDHPLAQAVLAEQQLRMGFWDGGTKLMTRALTTEPSGLPFLQLQKICADMSEAVAAGKVSAEEATRFINRLDSALPRTQNHISAFLASMRRALSSGQALDLTQLPAQARAASPSANAPRPQQAPGRPAQPAPRPSPSAPVAARPPSVPSGRAGDFMRAMIESRAQNKVLQQMIEPLPPASWPSAHTESIDTIPRLESQSISISELFKINQRQKLRITNGSIIAEIYLERARHALEIVQRGPIGQPVTYAPTELSRLEINMLDGMIQQLPEVVTADLGVEITTKPALAGLGALIGECLVRRFGGTWLYDKSPERSAVLIGDAKLDPFAVAQRWLQSGSSEESGLIELIAQARAAVPRTGTLLRDGEEHIDLTAGLSGRLLDVRLAEQWALYRNANARAAISEIADDVQVLADQPHVIVLSLSGKWLPAGAKLTDGRAPLVYIRATGEFLCGWQPRAAARAARYAGGRLDDLDGGAARIMEVVCHTVLFRQQPIGDRETAQRLNNQLGREVVRPIDVQVQGAVHRLTVWAVVGGTELHKWVLEAPTDPATPWKLARA
jgi:tetratricopeptide (TPR) repeat protein